MQSLHNRSNLTTAHKSRTHLLFAAIGSAAMIGLIIIQTENFMIQTALSTIFIALAASSVVYCVGDKIIAFLSHPARFYLTFYLVFYILGLLPISTLRDYLDIRFWLLLVALGMISFVGGWMLKIPRRSPAGSVQSQNQAVPTQPAFLVLVVSTVAAGLTIILYGVAAINPDLRFSIHPKLAYFIEACIPAAIVLIVFKITRNRQSVANSGVWKIALYSSVLLLSVGYHNKLFIMILGFALAIIFAGYRPTSSGVLRLRMLMPLTLICFLGMLLFAGMYIIKAERSDRLLGWEEVIEEYDIKYADKLLLIIPVHKPARGCMGVTQIALEKARDIEVFCPKSLLILLDMATVLPGKQISSGRVLGIVVKNDDTASLTPGALGGLYISWGFAGVVIFYFAIGNILSYLWNTYRQRGSPWPLICCILILIYLVQFTYRGLFKPMYLFTLIVVWFIWAFTKMCETRKIHLLGRKIR